MGKKGFAEGSCISAPQLDSGALGSPKGTVRGGKHISKAKFRNRVSGSEGKEYRHQGVMLFCSTWQSGVLRVQLRAHLWCGLWGPLRAKAGAEPRCESPATLNNSDQLHMGV